MHPTTRDDPNSRRLRSARSRWNALRAGATLAALAFPAAASAAPVTVQEAEMTLPWFTSEPIWKVNPNSNAALIEQKGSHKAAGSRTFKLVVLENDYLRVEVCPEIGGAVSRVIHKPSKQDMFFWEGKAKDWRPWWESGVKASFPYREHGVGMEQPAGWRVVKRDDGSATIAMWMEFSRHNQKFQTRMYGRYTNLLLSQFVTLKPGRGTFAVTYRLVNPAPYPQGRQCWADALYPRNHTPEGVVQGAAKPPPTDTELIYPTLYISGHGGEKLRKFNPDDVRIAQYTVMHTSLFAWDIRHGFVGLWYPAVKVNRLRLTDPATAPGAKIYVRGEGSFRGGGDESHMYNFIELWGGTDSVFEGVEHVLDPGEAYAFGHEYGMTSGIGKAADANPGAAVAVELGDRASIEAVTWEPVSRLECRVDGAAAGAPAPCGPDRPARFALDGARKEAAVKLTGDGRVLLDQRFPLQIPDDTTRHDHIKATMGKRGLPAPLSGVHQQLWWGHLDGAIGGLEKNAEANRGSGEADYLLGVARLEKGEADAARGHFEKALAAERPYARARYFLAVIALGRKDEARLVDAMKLLEPLLKDHPNLWEGRLLLAWCAAQSRAKSAGAAASKRGREPADEDPADPRAAYVLAEGAAAAGDGARAAEARQALEALLKEPGAAKRLDEFKAATAGRYVAPTRIAK
jgi:tetratricopeptide (TPR) repeat protein